MNFKEILDAYNVFSGLWFFCWCGWHLLTISWDFQVRLGNYLKHRHPKSWLRKFWWAMCDQEGGCEYCSNICNGCGQWIQWQYNWKKREVIKKDIEKQNENNN